MDREDTGKRAKTPSGGTSGTYGVAPLGYIEMAGTREALQEAAEEITRVRKEDEVLEKKLHEGTTGTAGKSEEKKWDYSHLKEVERAVIEAWIRRKFRDKSVQKACQQLSGKYGKSESTFRRAYKKLRDYGTLDLVKS